MNPRPLTDTRLARTAVMLILLQCGLADGWAQSADDTMLRAERMRVEHRDPASLVSALRPLVGQGGSIGVVGDWLIVAASGNDRTRVRRQLDELDTPLTSVRIRLEFPENDASEEPPAETAGDTTTAPQPQQRELEADIGQTITLNLPGDAGSPDQLSLRVNSDGRRLLLSWRIHEEEESSDQAPEQQIAAPAGDWRTLVNGIRVRLEPLR